MKTYDKRKGTNIVPKKSRKVRKILW